MSTDVSVCKDYPQARENRLYIGEKVSVPINTAKLCWMYRSVHVVEIFCDTQRKKNGAKITLELGNAEKVKECIKLLISNSQVQIFLPSLRKIQADAQSIQFEFESQTQAEEFITYYAPCFFPEGYTCKSLDPKRFYFISEGQCNDVVFAILKKRIHSPLIEKQSYECYNPQFSSLYYENNGKSNFDFEGKWVRSFSVNTEEIQRIEWKSNAHERRIKTKVAITSQELDEWILISHWRLLHEWPALSRVWEKLQDAMIDSNNPELEPFIKKIDELLFQYDQICARDFLKEFHAIPCSVHTQVLLNRIYAESFPELLSYFGGKKEVVGNEEGKQEV